MKHALLGQICSNSSKRWMGYPTVKYIVFMLVAGTHNDKYRKFISKVDLQNIRGQVGIDKDLEYPGNSFILPRITGKGNGPAREPSSLIRLSKYVLLLSTNNQPFFEDNFSLFPPF